MKFLFVTLFLPALSLAQEINNPPFKRLTSVNDSYPMSSPDGKRIVFQSDRTGDTEIFSINTDGTNLRRLTNSPGYDGNPTWSPDGLTIVFASRRDNNLEVYTMQADGSQPRRLTNAPGNDGHPHWYPDGSRIIFNSARTSVKNGKYYDELFTMKPDGSDVRQLTDLKSVSTYPSISPDGKKILFRGTTDSPSYRWDMQIDEANRNSEIFVMDIEGRHLVNLSMSPAFDGWPAWSPDSKQVVFASNRSGLPNRGQLYLVQADGSGIQRLTDVEGAVAQPAWSVDGKYIYAYQLWESPQEQYGHIIAIDVGKRDPNQFANAKLVTATVDSYPDLSPDGARIVFESTRAGARESDIYTASVDGSNVTRITDAKGDDSGPSWSPDGTKILFVSTRDGNAEIYVMNPDGSSQVRLTNHEGDDAHPHWSSDGSRIIFNSARTSPDLKADWRDQFHEIFSMKADGTDVRQHTNYKTVSTYPNLSPDGSRIVHRRVTQTAATNWDLTANVRGRNSEVFTADSMGRNAVNISNHPAYDGWPVWSPDGTRILFVSNRNGKANGGQLFVANADGSGCKQLTDLPGGIVQPSWSRNGKYVLAAQVWEMPGGEFANVIMLDVEKALHVTGNN